MEAFTAGELRAGDRAPVSCRLGGDEFEWEPARTRRGAELARFDALIALGLAAQDSGEREAAEDAYREILAVDPTEPPRCAAHRRAACGP